MQFTVSTFGKHRSATLRFGTPADVRRILRWRKLQSNDANVLDALEFRKLATKRWKYYERANESAQTIGELRNRIEERPDAEIGFLVVAVAAWERTSPILGCCFCRRSWCNHLILDFLAVHPEVVADREPRGVGTGIIYSLVALAGELGIPMIWGEATRNSAPFYEKILNLKRVDDQFHVGSREMEFCREQMNRLRSSSLQKASKKQKLQK